MVKNILILLAFILDPQTKSMPPVDIVGCYYMAAYSKSHFEGKITLKKDFPIQSDSIYKPENDIDKTVEFQLNGSLILRELPDSYYCGDFLRVEGGDGSWRKLAKNEIEIIWLGKTAVSRFEIKRKYRIDPQSNGDKILTPLF